MILPLTFPWPAMPPTQVPLFKECEEAFITQLVMRLKLGVFLPGEIIFRIGDVGHEMYFITKVCIRVGQRSPPLSPACFRCMDEESLMSIIQV